VNLRNEFIELTIKYHNGENIKTDDFISLFGKKDCYIRFNRYDWVKILDWENWIKNEQKVIPTDIDDIYSIKWCERKSLINGVKVKMDFEVVWKETFPNVIIPRFLIYYGGSDSSLKEDYTTNRVVRHFNFYNQKTKYVFENTYTPNYIKFRNDIIFRKIKYTSNEIVNLLKDEFLYFVYYEVVYYTNASKQEITTSYMWLDNVCYDEVNNINENKLKTLAINLYKINEDLLISVNFYEVNYAYILQIISEPSITYVRAVTVPIHYLTIENENALFYDMYMLGWVESIYEKDFFIKVEFASWIGGMNVFGSLGGILSGSYPVILA